MKKVCAIIAYYFLHPDQDVQELHVGGIESWLLGFVRTLTKLGVHPVVYQYAKAGFHRYFEEAEIIGISDWVLPRKWWRRMFIIHRDIARQNIRHIVYTSSWCTAPIYRHNQIFVQHGVFWDGLDPSSNPINLLMRRRRAKSMAARDLQCYLKSRLTIAVDTNFINFARATLKDRFSPSQIAYVPNFAVPQPKQTWGLKWQSRNPFTIVVPRRFEYHRGFPLIIEPIRTVLNLYPDLKVVFSGRGPMERELLDSFRGDSRVSVQETPHRSIYSLLNAAHLVVIPTVYSEGTSFSCLEAMASGCAVIATDVGGLTNIIIPDENGLLVRPTNEGITNALIRLISNPAQAETFAERGYQTCSRAFSYDVWQERIFNLISPIFNS